MGIVLTGYQELICSNVFENHKFLTSEKLMNKTNNIKKVYDVILIL